MKPPVYAMMPPRVDAPKVGKMKPVEQPKIAKMRGIDEALRYYLGPTGIPDRLAAVNQMLNPVETMGGSMRASQRMLAPDTAPMARVQAAGDMLSGVAGFAAPMGAASKVGAPAASAVADAFTGLSTGARKAGATVVDRLNQPGPMPTLYSNPIPGLTGAKKGIRAYHGSPHSFDKFSMEKIGTGEGAQAYGHGLYFADSEDVARKYRDVLGGVKEVEVIERPEGFEAFARRRGENDMVSRGVYPTRYLAEQAGLKNQGSMYEVQINADPETFLDWDKPLSEQPQAVRDLVPPPAAWKKIDAGWHNPDFGAVERDGDGFVARLSPGPNGMIVGRAKTRQEAQAFLEPTQKVSGGSIEGLLGGGEETAQRLREAGIPGIKYLDAGSRGAGGGSRNYVVFDDSLIDIIRKYGIAGLMMGGMMQPNQAQAGQ